MIYANNTKGAPDPTNVDVQERETFRWDKCRVMMCSFFLLVLEDKLDILVGEGHQVGADQRHHSVQNCRLDEIHVPDPPEQPYKHKTNQSYIYIYR